MGDPLIKCPNSKKAREEGEAIDEIEGERKDAREEGEAIDEIEGERKDEEEVTYMSSAKKVLRYIGSYFPIGGKVEIHEEKEKEGIRRENEGKKQEPKTAKGKNEAREEMVRKGRNIEIIINGIEFTREDIESLEDGKWLTCTGISMGITMLKEDVKGIIQENKILLIRPEIAQIFQYGDRESVKQHKEELKTKDYEWIFYPVNKNKPGEVYGGIHWSLLIFSKQDHMFYHFDPLKGLNEKYAKIMMTNLMDEDSYDERGTNLPAFYEGNCTKQENGYDCGPYVLQYMRSAVNTIGEKKNGRGFGDMHPEARVLKFRRYELQQEVQDELRLRASRFKEEIGKGLREEREKDKEEREKEIEIISEQVRENNNMEVTEQGSEDDHIEVRYTYKDMTKANSIADKNYTDQSERKGEKVENRKNTGMDKNRNTTDRNLADMSRNQDRVTNHGRTKTECRFYLKGDCWRGEHCRFEHKDLCEGWTVNGECGNDRCKYAHKEKCKQFYKGECQRINCRYLHPTGIVVVNIQQGNQIGTLDHKQQNWQNPGRTQERNWMQKQNRNFLGNQSVPYQNQQMRQNPGMVQERQWNQNQNQNSWRREQMAGNLNPWGECTGIQNANYGYPVPTEILIRAGWERLMNQGGMWWT